jgi:hypothetical protein
MRDACASSCYLQHSLAVTAPAAPPQRGTLIVSPDQNYLFAVGALYPVDYAGHLAGAPNGVKIVEAFALPLPRSVAGSYQSCVALDWTSNQRWSYGLPSKAPWPTKR